MTSHLIVESLLNTLLLNRGWIDRGFLAGLSTTDYRMQGESEEDFRILSTDLSQPPGRRSREKGPPSFRRNKSTVTELAKHWRWDERANRVLTQADPNYEAALRSLPKHERERLYLGSWHARPAAGGVCRREWFKVVDAAPVSTVRMRAWDLAATVPNKPSSDPDWTVGVLVSRPWGGSFTVEDVIRFRGSPMEVEKRIRNVAEQDGDKVTIVLPTDPGAAGKSVSSNFSRVLEGFRIMFRRPTGSKVERAGPVSSQCEAGNVQLVKGPWNDVFLRELEAFPTPGVHDDQVDAFVDAALTIMESRRILLA